MCSPAPPPALATALLTAPWVWFGSFLLAVVLGLCLIDWFTVVRQGNWRARRTVLVLSALDYLAALTGVVLLTMDQAWQNAVLAWDSNQIDVLERHNCSIAVLGAVDARSEQLVHPLPVPSYVVYACFLLVILAFVARGLVLRGQRNR